MNLYREVTETELQSCIDKTKNFIIKYMQAEEEAFTEAFNRGDYALAHSIASRQIHGGYRMKVTALFTYIDAWKRVREGEKIYTDMLDVRQS